MFLNTQGGGLNLAVPDVCKTTVGPAVVPIPYPNMAQPNTAVPTQFKLLVTALPGHNLTTQIPMSNGDNAGALGGVASQMMMGPCRHVRGSTKVMAGAGFVTRLLDTTGQNGMNANAPGTSVAPSQVKVLILS